jgi:chaperonin GroEL
MKEIQREEELRKSIEAGVSKLADAVVSTLGPCGRNVILKDNKLRPYITKDGVSVAKHIKLQDPFEDAAASIIKQAAEQTGAKAGDGTTTSTCLARAMMRGAFAVIDQGASPIEVQRGMNRASELISVWLKERSQDVQNLDDIRNVATISANGDRGLGQLIASAVDAIGKNGALTIKESNSTQTSLDIQEGFRFPGGYEVDKFINDERSASVKLDNALVLVTDLEFITAEQMLVPAELAAREGKPLVIIAEKIEEQALATMIYYNINNKLKCAFIKAPFYGEERRNLLDDLAVKIGAKYLSRLNGHTLKDVNLANMAVVENIQASKYETIVLGKENAQLTEQIEERIARLQEQLSQAELGREAEQLQDRITRLSSAIGVIKVGAPTEVEMKEKKDRIEDALEAVKSAQDEGILPGGGLPLWWAGKALEGEKWENDDQKAGAKVVVLACREPLRQMLRNAGLNEEEWTKKMTEVNDPSVGINVYKKELTNLMDVGVIDPCKVTRSALENAVSAAGTLVTTSFASIEVE